MRIPHDRLSPDALRGVIEEYVTRDGTELSEAESKGADVRRALERGELVVVFDPDRESCNLLTPDEAEQAERVTAQEPVDDEWRGPA